MHTQIKLAHNNHILWFEAYACFVRFAFPTLVIIAVSSRGDCSIIVILGLHRNQMLCGFILIGYRLYIVCTC